LAVLADEVFIENCLFFLGQKTGGLLQDLALKGGKCVIQHENDPERTHDHCHLGIATEYTELASFPGGALERGNSRMFEIDR
jgi:hypothetical protein